LEHMGVNMRLKALRKESRLTQEQLAKYLDVDQTLITKFENGSRAINVTMVDKLCSLFGCTQEYLLGQSEEYIPLNFAFRSQGVSTEDLQSIAAVNKIVMNLRCMNELIGGE
jgi:transcriptional regulator with XRE-family HTH domain